MELVLNTVSYHDCPVELREKLCLGIGQRRRILAGFGKSRDICEAVILQTCNRLEFYFYAEAGFDCAGHIAEQSEKVLPGAGGVWLRHHRQMRGEDCVRHLFEVAAGLDSQIMGENQILAQVKGAYSESLEAGTSKFVFHRLFHQAFRVGKAVRTKTSINCGAVSVALAAVELARQKMDLPACTAMVLGAGENSELVARYLVKAEVKRLVVANRTVNKAKALVRRLGAGLAVTLREVERRLAEADIVIASTGAGAAVVTFEAAKRNLAGRRRKLLAIDIAVPRDIEPTVGRLKCVELYNIDDLNERINLNKKKRAREAPQARAIVEEFTTNFVKWYKSLNVVPVISRLTRSSQALARRQAKRYAKDFGPGSGKKLELFALSLAKKIMHRPIAFVRGDSGASGAQRIAAVDLLNKMFSGDGCG